MIWRLRSATVVGSRLSLSGAMVFSLLLAVAGYGDPQTENRAKNAAEPLVAVSLTSITVTAMEESAAITRALDVWNRGGGTLFYGMAIEHDNPMPGAPPFRVAPSTGQSTGEVNRHEVYFNTPLLSPGQYTGRIVILTNAANGHVTIPVTLTVTVLTTEPQIAASPTQLSVTIEQYAVVTRDLSVWNSGTGTLMYDVQATPSGLLSVTPQSGQVRRTPNIHQVTVAPGGQAPGLYSGSIAISGNADNSPVTIPVTVTVTPLITEPQIAVSPTDLSVTVQQYDLVTRSMSIWNSGRATLVYDVQATPSWFLSVTPQSGQTTSTANTHYVTVTPGGLPPGLHGGSIHISGNATNTPLVVPVAATVITPYPSNLVASTIDMEPAAPVQLEPGDPLAVGGIITNDGQNPAPPFWIEIWGSRWGGLTLDYFLVPSLVVHSGIAHGQSYPWLTTAPLYSIPDGRYTVVCVVDRPGQVAETNERDNRAVVKGKQVLVVRPMTNADLAVEGFGLWPNPAISGGQIVLSGRVVNRGTEPSGAAWIEFWGSSDWPYPTPGFLLCDSILVENLAPGGIIDLSSYERTLYNVPVGVFQVGCTVDHQDVINESNETNNFQFVEGQVFNHASLMEPQMEALAVGADILIMAADFLTSSTRYSAPGETLTCAVTIRNDGVTDTGPFWLEYWGSRDGGLTVSDMLRDSQRVSNLIPGQTLSLDSRAPLYSVPDGPYSMTVWADRPDNVAETNERNNRVTVSGKRLAMIRPETGANLTLTGFEVLSDVMAGTVRNVGTERSGPFWIEFWATPGNPDYPAPYFPACESIHVANLDPGGILHIQYYNRVPYDWVRITPHVVIGYVDARDHVVETDETDNYGIDRTISR